MSFLSLCGWLHFSQIVYTSPLWHYRGQWYLPNTTHSVRRRPRLLPTCGRCLSFKQKAANTRLNTPLPGQLLCLLGFLKLKNTIQKKSSFNMTDMCHFCQWVKLKGSEGERAAGDEKSGWQTFEPVYCMLLWFRIKKTFRWSNCTNLSLEIWFSL